MNKSDLAFVGRIPTSYYPENGGKKSLVSTFLKKPFAWVVRWIERPEHGLMAWELSDIQTRTSHCNVSERVWRRHSALLSCYQNTDQGNSHKLVCNK